MQYLTPLLILSIVLAVAVLPILLLVPWVWWIRHRNARRSPLTTHLRHLPGQQAALEAERLMEAANDRLLSVVLVGPIVVMMWAFQKLDPTAVHFGATEAVLVVLISVVAFFFARSGLRKLRERWNYLDGIAAERATAQELMPLISRDCAIYHDVPADGFNLDHVVIGPGVVFMVETKSRRKPAARGADNAKVTFDGKCLKFPGWLETKPLEQARAQTRWLADYLYRKVGERVRVEPVLALPGWFVSTSVPSVDVHVINPRMHSFMVGAKGPMISDAQRRRIMTAIEERYPRND